MLNYQMVPSGNIGNQTWLAGKIETQWRFFVAGPHLRANGMAQSGATDS